MDEQLFGVPSFMGTVCSAAENNKMIKSFVHYLIPEEKFRESYTFEERLSESARILLKYPDRIPVICEHDNRGNAEILPNDPKKKFLIPREMTLGQLVYVFRRRMHLPPERAIFLFIETQNKKGVITHLLAPTAHIIDTLYKQYHDRDNFLYIVVSAENVFG